ncbi:hypothetical protein [Streptomyces niger]|uniref:hypothetical protein n=1 Tax=Streptomyces niger TaxID=66373 RepID=UPI00069A27B4|nr:hypothetical protein [Streptomyces niger]
MREETRRDPNALIRGLLELQMKAGKTTRRALADRIGIHVKTVANRMARAAELPLEELEELVHGLEPPDDIRAAIFRLAGRVAPPQYGIDPRCLPDMPTRRAYVDSIQRPSVLYTIGWRVVYCNKAYKELFAPGPFIPNQPGAMPLSNGVEYILFHRHAARLLGAGNQRAYDRHWRTLALAHVAAVDQSNSGDPDLKRILRRINERPNLHQAYRSAATWIREHGDVAVSSEPRPFFDPRTGQTTRAHVLTEAHENSPLQHATWMIDGEPDAD